MDILNIAGKTIFDNSITYAEKHSHLPYATNAFNNNDEIRISIQQQDAYTHPWNSSLYIEGKINAKKKDGSPTSAVKFANNGVLSLFDEIRFEVSGITVDRVRLPGIATTMKAFCSLGKDDSTSAAVFGWNPFEETEKNITDDNGNFSVVIPLRFLFGFCEDFKRILVNLRQELVLIRTNSDINAVICTEKDITFDINLYKVIWRVPHINVEDNERIRLLRQITSNSELDIPFRSWELHENPLLQQTTKQSWTIKSSSQLEKPRFIIFGFKTDRKNKIESDFSKFDHCNLSNVKLFLNSEMFPYDSLNLNFKKNNFATLYEMFSNFQHAYYGRENQVLLDPYKFKEISPLAVIDCSRQNEVLLTGSVDIRLEFETTENIPANTSAYCLIIHDKLIKYNPLTSTVRAVQ